SGRRLGGRASGIAADPPRTAGRRGRVLREPVEQGRRARVRDAAGRRRHEGDHRARAARISEPVTYEGTGRIARLTLSRPERGNGITRRLVTELEQAVERADLDPAVHVLLLSGNGKGFCGGYDLVESAEGQGQLGEADAAAPPGSPLDPSV